MAKAKKQTNFPRTLQQAILYFSDANNCTTFLAQMRWPNGVTCPVCDGDKVSFLSTRNVWKCKGCKKQFSVKDGTVMGLLERHGGEVTAMVVPNTRTFALDARVRTNVEKGSTVYTDALKSYSWLKSDYVHNVINHAEKYVDGQIHTNGIENFWSLL